MSMLISSTCRGLANAASRTLSEIKKRPRTTLAAVLGLSALGCAYHYQYSPVDLTPLSSPPSPKGTDLDVQAIFNNSSLNKSSQNQSHTTENSSHYEDPNPFSLLMQAIDSGSIDVLQKADKEELLSKIDLLSFDLILEHTAHAGSSETLKEMIKLYPQPRRMDLPSLLKHGRSDIDQTLSEAGLFNTLEKEVSDPSTSLYGFISYSSPVAALDRASLLISLVSKKPDYVERFLDKCIELKTSLTSQLYRKHALTLLQESIQYEHIALTEKIALTFTDFSADDLLALTRQLESASFTTNRELAYLKLQETNAFKQLTLLDIAKFPISITASHSSQIGDLFRTRYAELMEDQKLSLTKEDFEELLTYLGENHTLAVITRPEEGIDSKNDPSEEDLNSNPFNF